MTNLKKIELPPRGMNTLFGVRDENIKYLETLLNIRIGARGNELNIDGEAGDIETVEKILGDFAELFEQGNKFTDGELRDAFKQIAEDRAYSLKDYFTTSRFNPSGKKQVAAKSANQRKYIEAIQNNDLVFGIGPAGTGKCIAEDSIVLTEFGMLEIGELCRDAKTDEFLSANFAVSGIGGRENVSHVYNGGTSRTLKIQTRFGYSIEATPEHPLLVINTDGNLSWKRADRLKKGDFVTFQRGQKMFGNKIETNFIYQRKKHDSNSKAVETRELDEDFAYIMGILTGDGCLTVENRIIVSSGDEKILDAFQNLADRFSLKVFSANPSGFCYAIASSQLYNLLIHLGMSNGKAETKIIPRSILQAPQNIVAAFLRGLFETGGTVEKRDGAINFGSISEKLVKQIQIVLLNFGIVSSKSVKRGTYLGEKHFSNILSITGAEAEKFDELIGFGLKRKNERRQTKTSNTNIDVVPNIGKKLNHAVKSAVLTRAEHKKFWDYRIERRRPSYGKLEELLEILNNKNAKGESLNHLQAILENRFLFLEIAAIEESEAQVYDLTVPETHSFTANGFINHNSFLAVALAVQALFEKQVSRIILTRPAVEAGEKLGFLPGDLQDKVDPYLRPLYDALFDLVDGEKVSKMLEKRIIEIAPLAFMRGRTLQDAFIILDEAQNTTSEQMKMFLTRIGFGSKAVVTGDKTQIDLPSGRKSGIKEAEKILSGIEGISFINFTDKDVVRHKLVQMIVRAYEKHTNDEELKRAERREKRDADSGG